LAAEFDWIDGLSMSFGDWRFNLRTSSTEPLVRLNVETRANPELLEEKTQELTRALGH
jgi:phosphomannomutase